MYDCKIYLFLDPQHFLYFLVDPQSQRSLGFCFDISFLNRLHSFLCPGYANFWCSLQQYDAV